MRSCTDVALCVIVEIGSGRHRYGVDLDALASPLLVRHRGSELDGCCLQRFAGHLPSIAEFVRFATLAANGHNTQPWRFIASDRSIQIEPDYARRTPVVDPDDHHLYVSLGCAAENLAIAASAHGQHATVAFSLGRGIDIMLDDSAPYRDRLYDAIPLRQSTRSEFDGKALESHLLEQLLNAARIDGVAVRLLTTASDREAVLENVILGNSTQMDDPEFVAELRRWLRFNEADALASGDGLFSACSGKPTGPAWLARALFGLAFRKGTENDKYSAQLRSSAGVAVFIADRADPEGWTRVGRAFQRFALQATALGIRHAHVNQPVEVATVREQFARWLGIGEQRPDLVIRFGRAPALPMSLRRSVATVLVRRSS
jgi:hypothetical protein